MSSSSARLGLLLRRMAGSETRAACVATEADLKKLYYGLAKSLHPDLLVHSKEFQNDEAQGRQDVRKDAHLTFLRLKTDYEEASKLLKLGVAPSWGVSSSSRNCDEKIVGDVASSSSSSGSSTSDAHPSATEFYIKNGKLHDENTLDWVPIGGGGARGATWYQSNLQKNQRDPDVIYEFDLRTKLKGTLYVLVFGGLFCIVLREFLVATAGSCWGYKPPDVWSAFYIRRYLYGWEKRSGTGPNISVLPPATPKTEVRKIIIPAYRRVPAATKPRRIPKARKQSTEGEPFTGGSIQRSRQTAASGETGNQVISRSASSKKIENIDGFPSKSKQQNESQNERQNEVTSGGVTSPSSVAIGAIITSALDPPGDADIDEAEKQGFNIFGDGNISENKRENHHEGRFTHS